MKAQSSSDSAAWSLGSLLGRGYDAEDKAGRSRFDAACDALASHRADMANARSGLLREINDAAKSLHVWDSEKVKRLCLLVQLSGFSASEVGTAYKKALRTNLSGESNALSRGLVWNMLGALGEYPLPHVIAKDKVLQKEYPWLWIDIMARMDWKLTEMAILSALGTGGGIQNLLKRLPLFWTKRKGDLARSLGLWLPILSEEERGRLTGWMKRKGIKVPLWDASNTPAERAFVKGALSAEYLNSPQR